MYFITLVVKDRLLSFGQVENGEVKLSEVGMTAYSCLEEIPVHYPHVSLGEFIVMPNHVHLILILKDSFPEENTDVWPCHGMARQFGKPIAGSVSVIINQYKSAVKRWCNKNGFEIFQWQSRFHDHIIRDERAFRNISKYIVNNPAKWNQ